MSKVWRVAIGLVVGVCIVVSITGCTERDATPSPDPDKIRVVLLPFLTASPFFIADEEGYFDEQNLEVEFVRLARTIEAIPALARGEVDVGVGQLTVTVLNAIANGARIKLVAGTGYLAPDACTVNGVMARRALVESGRLTGPEQLRGLRVELDVLLPSAYYVDRLLEPEGLTLDDLDIVNLPTGSNVDALIRGTIDVTVVSEPWVSRLVQSGEAVVWRGSEQIVPDFQLSSVLFGPSLLDERPEVGERFMVAFLKAIRQYNLGKTPRNVEIIARGTGLTPEALQEVCWPSLRQDANVRTAGMMAYQEWLDSRALIDRIVPEEELLDRRFVEYAIGISAP